MLTPPKGATKLAVLNSTISSLLGWRQVICPTQDELSSWNLHLDATFPKISSHLSSWSTLSSLLNTGAKDLWHISSHTILTGFDFCNKDFLYSSPFFSSYMFPAYSQYSSWGSSSFCQVWNTSLRNFPHGTFMYSSASLTWSISKPFPLWRPWEIQPQLSLLTSPFNFSKFASVKSEILIREIFFVYPSI